MGHRARPTEHMFLKPSFVMSTRQYEPVFIFDVFIYTPLDVGILQQKDACECECMCMCLPCHLKGICKKQFHISGGEWVEFLSRWRCLLQ